jgi:hypothetical protein
MPYREDIDKKDQGRAFLAGCSASPAPNKDGPAIMAVITPAAGEHGGTLKTPSKRDILITTITTLTLYRSGDTSASRGCAGRLVDDPVSDQGRLSRRTPTEIPTC